MAKDIVRIQPPAVPVPNDFHGLSASDLESHIKYCGERMEAAMRGWQRFGLGTYLEQAHVWRAAMERAINSRRPDQVRLLEVARGLN